MSRKDRHFGDEDSTLNTKGERGKSVNTEGEKGIDERVDCGTLKVWGRKWTVHRPDVLWDKLKNCLKIKHILCLY